MASWDWRRSCGALLAVCMVVLLDSGCLFHRTPLQWTPSFNCTAPSAPKDFDVMCGGVDVNGSPLNPSWGAQRRPGAPLPPTHDDQCVREPFSSSCTSQSTSKDKARFPNAVICALEVKSKVHGHVNWTPATAIGRLTWMSLADDWDYNFHFFPDGDSGLTVNNASITTDRGIKRYIELEFDSRETIDNFQTPWWTGLANAVRTRGNVQQLLNNHPGAASQAIVYGLFGLDCEHMCQSEFHPVYALGFETDDRATGNAWAMFIRNWGDEGFCSQMDHELALPGGQLQIRLPHTGDRPTIDMAQQQFHSTNNEVPFPAVSYDATSRQVVLTFTLPPPEHRVNAELFLQLEWPGQSADVSNPLRVTGATAAPSLAAAAVESEDAEGYLHTLAQKVPRERESAPSPRPESRPAPSMAATPSVVRLPDYVPRPTERVKPSKRLSSDPEKQKRDSAYIAELCKANLDKDHKLPLYKGHDVSAMCKTRTP